MSDSVHATRRSFLLKTALTGSTIAGGLPRILSAAQAPALVGSDNDRPCISHGLTIGDVVTDGGMVWSRADRAARMILEYSPHPDFPRGSTIRRYGPYALEVTDFTVRAEIVGLPADTEVFVRLQFEALNSKRTLSAPATARFRTAPGRKQLRDIKFLWSGDTGGQGWGIDTGYGGMKLYETMRLEQPDFFLHCGDTIYADGPMQEVVKDASGTVIWRNAYLNVEPAKTKVAETLDEFRANYRYNLLDSNVQRFAAEVPQIWQWDDHEAVNNWSDSKTLDDRYQQVRDIQLLAGRAKRAFLEYAPMRWYSQIDSERIYRHIPYGRDLDLFVLDMRSYRGANSANRQTQSGAATAFLGAEQIAWLQHGLASSTATWKIIAADMPLGLIISDGADVDGSPRFEGVANGPGPAMGRELEIAGLLRFIKRHGLVNIVWLTADVHYCAAHYYDPNRARFQDFTPFWEFVAGPAHAGTFGPNPLDDTFGPQVVFQKVPAEGQSNLPPSAGLQFFGIVAIDSYTGTLQVSFKDTDGRNLFTQALAPQNTSGSRKHLRHAS